MTDYLWFFAIPAAGILMGLLWTLRDWLVAQKPWRFSLNVNELIAFTPWGGIVVANAAFRHADLQIWSGIEIFSRIPGAKYGPPKWEQIYRMAYRYDPDSRYEQRMDTQYVERMKR